MPERDDDQDWIRILGGKPAPDAKTETVKEAEAVRRAMLAQKRSSAEPSDVEPGLQRLLFRLRQEKLLDRPFASWQTYAGFALAASLALGIAVTVLVPRSPDDSGPEIPKFVVKGEPVKHANDVVRELETVGITARITAVGETVRVEADWPAQPNASQQEFLTRHKLPAPQRGRLRIEIRSEAK